MEEKSTVGNITEVFLWEVSGIKVLSSLKFTMPLNFEDPHIVSIVVDRSLIGIFDIMVEEIMLFVALRYKLDLGCKALEDVVNWVHLHLSVEGSEQQLRSMLNVAQVRQVIIHCLDSVD